MFSIAADRLTIGQIARFWAKESSGGNEALRREHKEEFLALLFGAWCQGELGQQGRLTPLEMLQALYLEYSLGIIFRIGDQGSLQYRGELSTRPRVITLPVPSSNTATWNIENCQQAFSILAAGWQKFKSTQGYQVFGSELEALEISRNEFYSWIALRKLLPPNFWISTHADVAKSKPTGLMSTQTGRTLHTTEPGGRKQRAVEQALAELYPGRDPSRSGKAILDAVNGWLIDHQCEQVGIDTVRRALKVHRSRIAQK